MLFEVMTPSAASPIWLTMSSSVTLPSAMNLMPDLSSPRSTNCRMKAGPNFGRHEAEQRIRLRFGDALEERREIRIGERDAQRLDHVAAERFEAPLERGLSSIPGA